MKIGMTEMLLVFIVALVVIGPDRLPYYAKKLGQALGQFRKYTEEATKDIRESIVEPLNEAQKPLREAMEPVTELEKDIQKNVKDIQKTFSDIGKPVEESSATAGPVRPSEETAPDMPEDLSSYEPAAADADETGEEAEVV